MPYNVHCTHVRFVPDTARTRFVPIAGISRSHLDLPERTKVQIENKFIILFYIFFLYTATLFPFRSCWTACADVVPLTSPHHCFSLVRSESKIIIEIEFHLFFMLVLDRSRNSNRMEPINIVIFHFQLGSRKVRCCLAVIMSRVCV